MVVGRHSRQQQQNNSRAAAARGGQGLLGQNPPNVYQQQQNEPLLCDVPQQQTSPAHNNTTTIANIGPGSHVSHVAQQHSLISSAQQNNSSKAELYKLIARYSCGSAYLGGVTDVFTKIVKD